MVARPTEGGQKAGDLENQAGARGGPRRALGATASREGRNDAIIFNKK